METNVQEVGGGMLKQDLTYTREQGVKKRGHDTTVRKKKKGEVIKSICTSDLEEKETEYEKFGPLNENTFFRFYLV